METVSNDPFIEMLMNEGFYYSDNTYKKEEQLDNSTVKYVIRKKEDIGWSFSCKRFDLRGEQQSLFREIFDFEECTHLEYIKDIMGI